MRLIADGVVDREGVDGLAVRLGYSVRQINRLLVAELGAGPLALARAQRAQTARALLAGTDLKLADVAFAAGFGSIRQFNDTIAEIFAATPSEIRSRAHGRRDAEPNGRRDRRGVGGGSPRGRPSTHPTTRQSPDHAGAHPDADAAERPEHPAGQRQLLRLGLPVRLPFDARGVLGFLAARAIEGVESADLTGPELRYARTLALPHGPGAFEVRYREPDGDAPDRAGTDRTEADRTGTDLAGVVRVAVEVSHLADVPVAVSRIRRLLDLDADPVAVDRALAGDPGLAASVGAVPGIRVPGAVDAGELLVRAIVGQQISVAAARTHLSRLAAAAGSPYASAIAGLSRLFPTPEQVADGARDHLRLPARNLGTIESAARALAGGELAVTIGDDPDDLRERLVARPGIGPWTADYVALRALGDPDVFLPTDLGVRRALADHPAADPATWAPWRSYALLHLWTSLEDA
jgi:AraC family transcriptional regulator of adaptative response / DNA-3-methyladenine glycosylase II